MSEQESAPQAEAPKSFSLLASERFPSSYKGEVKEPEAVSVEPEETVTVEASEPVEGEQVESAEVTETVEDETIEADTVTVEDSEGSSIEEFAEYLRSEHDMELSVDDLYLDLKVNGKDSRKSIAEIKAAVQKMEAADDILESAKTKAKSEREALTQELQHQANQATQHLTTAAAMVQQAEALLANDRQNVDWETLRKDNPSEYSALREDFKDRENAINNLKSSAAQSYQQWQAEAEAKQKEAFEQHLQVEHERLLERIPEWKDESKAAEEKAAIGEFLLGSGFEADEISQAADHRLIMLARDAMLYRKQSATVETTKKKIAKIPKVIKAGSPKSADQQSSERVSGLQKRLHGSGKIEDAFALLQAKRGK